MTQAEKDDAPLSHDALAALEAPPPLGKPLLLGGLAAFAGAAVWALLVVYAHVEIGYLAWGIGLAVGAAMTYAGARGNLLALAAGVLALLSIGSGKHMAFRTLLSDEATKIAAGLDKEQYEAFQTQCDDWAKLGDSPTDAQIRAFVKEQGIVIADPTKFRAMYLPQMQWFLENKPNLEQWRANMVDTMQSQYTFLEYLKEDFNPIDILFAFLGIATAFGMVSKATMAHRMAIAQMQIEARRATRGAKGDDAAE
ncbi:MAG: hypothetical protein U1F60_10990 [Planctomycetota bacterium]